MKIKIITDSTNDLDEETLKENDILVLPLYVQFQDESYLDGKTITTPELYKKIEEKNELPKTAAISMETFKETFNQYASDGFDIIY
ncbi:MAG: DegV family protein, partial [Anaeroplasmataceae bacterium]|nr:DegV family protein [Anaeroplasmataceae bacterium]